MISIITPTYNRIDMLKSLIESIRVQTYKDYEIIIIDDCSTDDTEEIIQEMSVEDSRIRYYKNSQNMGPGYNRNKGYTLAKGEYVIFADDDDYYTDPEFFQEAVHVYEENEEGSLACVCADSTNLYMESGRTVEGNIGGVGRIDGIDFLINIEIKYHKPLSTFPSVFSKKILDKANLKNMKMVNDYAIYLRALLFGDIYVLKRYVGMYRQHENNISSCIQRDFLIKNMEERFWVKEKLKGRTSARRINTWWFIQIRILLTYYIFNAGADRKDVLYVTKWALTHTGFAPRLWGMLLLRGIKILVKKLIR